MHPDCKVNFYQWDEASHLKTLRSFTFSHGFNPICRSPSVHNGAVTVGLISEQPHLFVIVFVVQSFGPIFSAPKFVESIKRVD